MAHTVVAPHVLGRRRATARSAQRGLALAGVVTLMMALLFAVLAIDTARLWVEQRNLQKVADMAALQSARFTGCGSALSDALTAVNKAIVANQIQTPGSPVSVVVRTNGIEVTITRTVPKSLLLGGWEGWFQNGSTSASFPMRVSSTARGGPPVMAFSLGSRMLDISTQQGSVLNSLFSGLLGVTRQLTITPDGYEGLAGLDIKIGDLMKATGATSLDELLNTPLPAAMLIDAIMQSSSDMSPATLAALQELFSTASSSNVNVTLGQVLDLQTQVLDDTALLNTNLNALDLISTSLRVGTSQSRVSFGVDVLGIGVDVSMGKASKLAVGPAGKSAVTGQYCTEARVDNTEIGINLAPSLLSALGVIIDFRLAIVFAPAVAHAERLQIAAGDTVANMGVNTGLVTARISNKAGTGPGILGIKPPFLPVLKVAEVRTKTDNTFLTFQNVPVPIETPIQDNLPAYSNGSSQASGVLQNLFSIGNLDIKLLGLNFSWVASLLKPISDLLTGILSVVVDPILIALGLNIGSADIRIFDIQSNQPSLAI